MKERALWRGALLTLGGALLSIALVAAPADSREELKLADHVFSDRGGGHGFGARLLLVDDPERFAGDWEKYGIPKIRAVTHVNRGDGVGAVILFNGCAPDAGGRCDLEVDYTAIAPEGRIYSRRQRQPLWREASPAPNSQVGRASLAMRIRWDDPAGEYSIRARVADRNAGISIALATSLHVR